MTERIVTGGLVSIEDGIKAKEEFAPARKVRVELSFDTPEDGNNVEFTLDAIAALADKKVKELLGKAKSAAQTHLTAVEPPQAVAETPKTETKTTTGTKRGPKVVGTKTDKDKLAEATHGPLPDALAQTQASADDLLGDGQSGGNGSSDASGSGDLMSALEDPEPPKEISDLELNRIVSEHLEKFKTAPEEKRSKISMDIRKRMASHIGEGKPVQLRGVPQENRADFVAYVQSLK